MPARSIRTGLLTGCIAAFGLVATAHAEVYTWTDASGKINVSNLTPPDGVRVTNVVREQPRTAADVAREAAYQRQQMQALADRVRQLESELQAPRDPPPAAPPIVIAPVIQYVTAPFPEPYMPAYETPSTAGCDPYWFGCGGWGAFYPGSVAVLRTTPARHLHRFQGRITPLGRPGFGPGFSFGPGSMAPPARRNR